MCRAREVFPDQQAVRIFTHAATTGASSRNRATASR
jgi:hypothetical protein